MLYKNPQTQEALLSRGVRYDSAPAVRDDSKLIASIAANRARSRNAGKNAQTRLEQAGRRTDLAQARGNLNKRRFDFQRQQFNDSLNTAWDRFDAGKKAGTVSSLFGLADLGIRIGDANKQRQRNKKIVSAIDDMVARTRNANDAEGLLVAQILKARYGE